MKIKELTDLKIASFVGVTNRTLQNWKKPTKIIGDIKIYAPAGKHNLYKGAKLATYLLDYKQYLGTDEDIEVSEPSNNLEKMLQSINTISNLIEIVENNCNNKYIKDLKEEVEELKNKLEDLQKLTIL